MEVGLIVSFNMFQPFQPKGSEFGLRGNMEQKVRCQVMLIPKKRCFHSVANRH